MGKTQTSPSPRPIQSLLPLLLASPLLFTFFPQGNRFEIIREVSPILALGAVVLLWIFSRGSQKNTQATNLPLFALFLAFLGLSTLSWVFSDIQMFGFAEIFVLWICFLIYLAFSQEESWRAKIAPALGITLVLATFIGIKGFLTTDHSRFFGFFYDPLIKPDAWPNAFADFFLLTFPFFTLYFWKNAGWTKRWKPLIFILTALVLAGFVLSGSRGAFLALIPAVGFLVLVQLRHKIFGLSKKSLLSALLVVFFTAFFVSGLTHLKNQSSEAVDLSDRLTFSGSEGGNSFSERLQFFEGAVKLIEEKPLLGYGPSTFKPIYPSVQQGFLAISDHPHNLWLKLAVERGIPAVLCLLLFIVYLFAKTNPLRKNNHDAFTIAAWTALLALLAHEMIDYNLNFLTNALPFWFILGGLASRLPKQKSRLVPLALLAVGLAIAVSGLKLASDERSFNTLNTVEQTEAFHPWLPTYEWYEKIGSTQDPELKTAFIQKQLQANPLDADTWAALGNEKLAENDLPAARQAFEAALQVDPKNTFAHYLDLARLLVLQNDSAALESLAQTLAPLFDEYQALYEANLHFTRGTKEMEKVEELKGLLK